MYQEPSQFLCLSTEAFLIKDKDVDLSVLYNTKCPLVEIIMVESYTKKIVSHRIRFQICSGIENAFDLLN